MKKLIVLSMAMLFMAATSGLVLAQGTAASSPAKVTAKHVKKGHKKCNKKAPCAKTAPVAPAKGAPAAGK